MLKPTFISLLLLIFSLTGCAQNGLAPYVGSWEGQLEDLGSFSLELSLELADDHSGVLRISNRKPLLDKSFRVAENGQIQMDIAPGIQLRVNQTTSGAWSGFVQAGVYLFHVKLEPAEAGTFVGRWNPFMVDQFQHPGIYLGIEEENPGEYVAYPFFGDRCFTGTWAGNFEISDEEVRFQDFKTALGFRADLREETINLFVLLGEAVITEVKLVRSTGDWDFTPGGQAATKHFAAPGQLKDGWATAPFTGPTAKLAELVDSIQASHFPNVHSLLVAQGGELILEKYFQGHTARIPHDQRSASKSIGSAMIGMAIEDGLISGTPQPIFELLPAGSQVYAQGEKGKMRVQDLLTMSGGLEISRTSSAAENNYQNTDDWLKAVLSAPMANVPGEKAIYGSAYPYLLGLALAEQLDIPLEQYMDEKLMQPLGIHNYVIQTDNSRSTPYFGGGMYMTPRDMLKFGQLYLNGGQWEGQQVLSPDWVKKSFGKYHRLEGTTDNNEYGYLWWHKDYQVGNQVISSIEARGNGGQYIFVLPELETVVVITSGNYNNGTYLQQPERILEGYVLPSLLRVE